MSSDAVTVTMLPPAPIVTLAANPGAIAAGTSAVLSWSSTSATSCAATGGWTGARATTGTERTTTLAADANYTLTCSGPGGNDAVTASVDVIAPPTVTFSVDPENVAVGGFARATWSATEVAQCVASGSWSGNLASNGTQLVGPLAPGVSAFTLECTNLAATIAANSAVTAEDPVEFVGVSFLNATNPDAELEHDTVPGEPLIGAGNVFIELSGPIANVAFHFVDTNGELISSPSLNSPPPVIAGTAAFQGNVTVPAVPFQVFAKGMRSDGRAFQIAARDVFKPQPVMIRFIPAQYLVPGIVSTIAVQIDNLAEAADMLVQCIGVTPLSVVPPRVNLAVPANSNARTSVDVQAVPPISLENSRPELTCAVVVTSGEAVGAVNRATISLPVQYLAEPIP